MRRLLIPFTALALLLSACQSDVVVNTPTTPPSEGFVSEPDTPAPTSTNTTDPVAARDMRLDSTARPLWLRQRIQSILATRKRNPIIRITRYEYEGQTVYYESAPCCDQYSTVYDVKGQILCHPEGGITGKGDGKCANFDKRKANEQLVWQDPR
ncbi:DUF6970 domain-containing protein [Hymenobacter sp. BRD67]|uniref:DUF6970 domain-containing protein n=1 Tax=Hymenobacter sp. BRD67 TaxID=2675877 RepID=UPI0015667800|nr:hypothetical protein [Hymenobacter sp. BRD67]QKG54206.1 hypothetical protein GKZ67_18405 [Hymenobacter sp. BRD67]